MLGRCGKATWWEYCKPAVCAGWQALYKCGYSPTRDDACSGLLTRARTSEQGRKYSHLTGTHHDRSV